MKRLPLVVLAALAFTLAACGDDGGGGDEEAFCDSLEALSDQVVDGDLADDDGLEDALDSANELAESAADGEQLDAVNEVRDVLADGDSDADQAVEAIQDELGDFAEDCDIDEDEFAVAPTTTEPPPDSTTAPPDSTTLPPETTAPDGGDIEVNARQPVPGDIAAEFAGQAQGCFDGDAAACDELFAITPIDSPDEAYGETCGGRLAEPRPGECSTLITGPTAVPGDVVDQANGAACFDGDMVACDDMFRAAEQGSPDQFYGGLCGGRVQSTSAFCVDIFGEQAFA